MSNSTAIALIIATFMPLYFLFFYITRMANDVAAEIETGVIRGVPVSTKYRGIMLYSTWAGYATGVVALGIFAAMLNIQIAANVPDDDIKALAYVGALIGGVAAFGWMVNGINELIHYRSILRQAESD